MAFTQENKSRREAQRQTWDMEGKGVEAKDEDAPEDFLDKLLDMKRDQKKGVNDYHCFIMGLSNIIAGSDTTAVSLSAILYCLLKAPRVMQKLRDEIVTKTRNGECESDRVSFKSSQEMPYLQAVIKEALRMHPAVGLPLWRVVNEGGAEICGEFLPAGSEVGINAYVAHFDRDVWGADVNEFRPERWIEAEKEGGDRIKTMEQYYATVRPPPLPHLQYADKNLQFGFGSRTCIGRHISYLEMTKLVPQIVRNFDFELQNPDKDWTCNNYWFVKPVDFYVRIKAIEKQI